MLPGKLLDLALLASYLYLYLDTTDWCTQGHIDDIMHVFKQCQFSFDQSSLCIFSTLTGYIASKQKYFSTNESIFSNDCVLLLFFVSFHKSFRSSYKCSVECTVNSNCVSGILHIMPSFSPSRTLKPSQFSPICPVWCNGQKDIQSAQAESAFWVRDCSFCYHMSTLVTKGFWHPMLGRMLAQILKQVGSSQMSHWITLSQDNLKKKTSLCSTMKDDLFWTFWGS